MLREVKTENGIVRGLPAADPRITAFKGIPFAAPPVGKNRWRAPQTCEDWEGVLEAYQFAPISVQDTPGVGDDIYTKEWHVDPDIPMSEDCLYLNVWTNAKSSDAKLPVMVWFFGGALQWGYPAEMEFDGERIARRDVVVVSVNYRINVFGFMAHPEITKESPEAPTNFGNLDQKAGLEWVIRNIEAFGGDPNNITIAGQSAGGGSVLSQMTCMKNEGLFQKAIVMSAFIRNPYDDFSIGSPAQMDEAEKNGEDFFAFIGAKTLDEARAMDAFYIRDKYAEYAATHPRFMTVQDNQFCCGDPTRMIYEGNYVHVPLMSGNTQDEFLGFIPVGSMEEVEAFARERFGEDAQTFMEFPEAKMQLGENQYAPVNGIACTVKKVFLDKTANGDRANNYYYCFNPDIPGKDQPGTFHSVDLWFFFETLAKCWRPFKGYHYDLSRLMCNYMTNFIKTGDPNGTDADGTPMPQWDPYTKENPCKMNFVSEGAVVDCSEETAYHTFMMEQIAKRI
ncbi:MAG: carboxylesterase family protein [Eubacteriales bacterium]|nr:carboxylesterase family protein [Eubacteriales bacterium]